MAQVNHQLTIRCATAAEYAAVLDRLALWNLNRNTPPIALEQTKPKQLEVNVVFSTDTVSFPVT